MAMTIERGHPMIALHMRVGMCVSVDSFGLLALHGPVDYQLMRRASAVVALVLATTACVCNPNDSVHV